MSSTVKIASAMAAVFACLFPNSGWTGDRKASPAAQAQQMSEKDIRHIYENRSWIWKDGAGLFQIRMRAFKSATHSGGDYTIADGRWFLPGRGKLCFRALWKTTTGSAKAMTCFEHRRSADGRIYQRRLPDGEWYVFAGNKDRRDDEIRKVKAGDWVTHRYDRYKRRIESDG